MVTNNAWNSQDPVQVAKGGTGAATLTDHSVLVGSGTGAITPIAVGATGTVLIGNTGADASFSATPTVTSINFGDDDLDYYEEGTWTPTLSFGGGSTGITYSVQNGTFTRIGNLLVARLSLVLTSKGTDNGAAVINGLPFTVASSMPTIFRPTVVTLPAGGLTRIIVGVDGTTTASLQYIGASSYANLTDGEFANNTALFAEIIHFV